MKNIDSRPAGKLSTVPAAETMRRIYSLPIADITEIFVRMILTTDFSDFPPRHHQKSAPCDTFIYLYNYVTGKKGGTPKGYEKTVRDYISLSPCQSKKKNRISDHAEKSSRPATNPITFYKTYN